MFKVFLDNQLLYLPGDPHYCIDNAILDLQLGGSNSFEFLCLQNNPLYDRIYNRRSFVQVFRDDKEIFFGEVRSQEKDFRGNKKVKCVGLLGFLADSIQPQKEYRDQTPHQLLNAFINEHNSQVEARKRFTIGRVTVSDPNNSLFRYSNFETTLACIKNKLVNRLGGYLIARHEFNEFYLDWLRLEDIGALNHQTISFGMNLLDYTEDLSADEMVTAVIPLGAEIENQDTNKVLKQYVDITSVNNGKNYLASREALDRFGWVCSVQHFDNVKVPSNLLKKGQEFLQDNQFENMTLRLSALDLSILGTQYESISLGDKIQCIAKPFGMDRIFPIMKLQISITKPQESKLQLGEKTQSSYIEKSQTNYYSLTEEIENNRKVTNSKIQSAVDNLTAQMQRGQGGYKVTEYDEQGRWLRDLYMDTMDKNTATKVLQVNLNGIGGSKNGYAGPYTVGMTLDGQILGERIVAGSITGEKLSISYTSQVEKKISDSKSEAIQSANSATDQKLKDYYTVSEINTKFTATDGKIEASVESLSQNIMQKNGNYYGGYTPSNTNAPANTWNTMELMKLHEGDMFFDTVNGYAYRYTLHQEVYEVTFSSDSITEGVSYDYVKFYYPFNGKLYATENCGGSYLAKKKVYIPSNVFWVYWRTDSSGQDYYGFRIESIQKVRMGYSNNDTESSLPTDAGGILEIVGNAYPESQHNPYPANDRKMWKYIGEQLHPRMMGRWERVKDTDIDNNKEVVLSALRDKNGNYYGTYVPHSNNDPAKKWLRDEDKVMHVGDMFYNTKTGYAYRYSYAMESLKIKFSSNSQTESANYDYVQIFYELDGRMYALPKIGGSEMQNAEVYVPATQFYVYWFSDSSNSNYYGFTITNISKASGYIEVKGVETALPTNAGTIINISGTTYPESAHSPYGDNIRKMWKYTSSETLSSFKNPNWYRVQDQDINIAKTKAEEAISRITVAEGNISTMVKKGEFGTYMQQNYNSFLLGFNAASKYIQIKAGEIGFYNGTINNSEKRAIMDEQGIRFYRDGYYVGMIGTNRYVDIPAHKGLVFDLDSEGKYMAFAELPTAGATSYTTMLCFSRANSIYKEYGLHLGCDLYCHGHKIISPQWETGFGITATMNFVQILSVDANGNPTKWGANGRMVFKDGVLMDLNYYVP